MAKGHLAPVINRWGAIFLTSVCLSSPLIGQRGDTVRILWWNAENAFDTVDDPLTYDEEFTPSGNKTWNSFRFYRKMNSLAKGLRAAAREHVPDFIGLCEIESPAVMDALLMRLPWEWNLWQYYEEGRDARGIDIVVLYNADHWELIESRLLENHAVTQTRSAIFTVFRSRVPPREPLAITWVHLPSRRRPNPGYRKHSLTVFCDEGSSDVIIGDMNSDPRGPLHLWMKELGYQHLPNSGQWGTYAFGVKWGHLDSVWRSTKSKWKGHYYPCPFGLRTLPNNSSSLKPTFYAGRYIGGASDHLPLRIDLF